MRCFRCFPKPSASSDVDGRSGVRKNSSADAGLAAADVQKSPQTTSPAVAHRLSALQKTLNSAEQVINEATSHNHVNATIHSSPDGKAGANVAQNGVVGHEQNGASLPSDQSGALQKARSSKSNQNILAGAKRHSQGSAAGGPGSGRAHRSGSRTAKHAHDGDDHDDAMSDLSDPGEYQLYDDGEEDSQGESVHAVDQATPVDRRTPAGMRVYDNETNALGRTTGSDGGALAKFEAALKSPANPFFNARGEEITAEHAAVKAGPAAGPATPEVGSTTSRSAAEVTEFPLQRHSTSGSQLQSNMSRSNSMTAKPAVSVSPGVKVTALRRSKELTEYDGAAVTRTSSGAVRVSGSGAAQDKATTKAETNEEPAQKLTHSAVLSGVQLSDGRPQSPSTPTTEVPKQLGPGSVSQSGTLDTVPAPAAAVSNSKQLPSSPPVATVTPAPRSAPAAGLRAGTGIPRIASSPRVPEPSSRTAAAKKTSGPSSPRAAFGRAEPIPENRIHAPRSMPARALSSPPESARSRALSSPPGTANRSRTMSRQPSENGASTAMSRARSASVAPPAPTVREQQKAIVRSRLKRNIDPSPIGNPWMPLNRPTQSWVHGVVATAGSPKTLGVPPGQANTHFASTLRAAGPGGWNSSSSSRPVMSPFSPMAQAGSRGSTPTSRASFSASRSGSATPSYPRSASGTVQRPGSIDVAGIRAHAMRRTPMSAEPMTSPGRTPASSVQQSPSQTMYQKPPVAPLSAPSPSPTTRPGASPQQQQVAALQSRAASGQLPGSGPGSTVALSAAPSSSGRATPGPSSAASSAPAILPSGACDLTPCELPFGAWRLVRLAKATPCDACDGTALQETKDGEAEVYQCSEILQAGSLAAVIYHGDLTTQQPRTWCFCPDPLCLESHPVGSRLPHWPPKIMLGDGIKITRTEYNDLRAQYIDVAAPKKAPQSSEAQ